MFKEDKLKCLVIPDVHGRTFWKEPVRWVLDNLKDVPIVFLGDYTDPYVGEVDSVTNTTIKREDGITCLKEVIELKKQNSDRITLLIGNHDLGYLNKYICTCRRDRANEKVLTGLFKDNLSLFNLATEFEVAGKKFLFTHAGITTRWVKAWETLVKDYGIDSKISVDTLNDVFHMEMAGNNEQSLVMALSYVSHYRGGYDNCSSLVWADIHDHLDIDSNDWADEHGYIQVFGHTQLSEDPISIDGKVFCLDVRRAFYIDKEGEIRSYNSDKKVKINIKISDDGKA